MKIAIHNWRALPKEKQGIAVVFDIFRCSTTLLCLAQKKQHEVWITKSLEHLKSQLKQFAVFSELPEQVSCLERFDNSPKLALAFAQDSPCLVATTSGTPAMFAARNYEEVLVGGLVNFSELIKYLSMQEKDITILPAAHPDSHHVEDAIVAEILALTLDGYADNVEYIEKRARSARDAILATNRKSELEAKIPTASDDVLLALSIDLYSLVPKIAFQPRSNIPGLAKVCL